MTSKKRKIYAMNYSEIPVTDQVIGFNLTDNSVPLTQKYYRSFSNVPRTQRIKNNLFLMSQTGIPRLERRFQFTRSGVLFALQTMREIVMDYQESRGVPRNEEITFVTLVTSLCTQAYTAIITILVMLWNLMPLVDGIVYFIRFILDKMIDIVRTEDCKESVIKVAILFGELTIITFIIFIILGFIFMPVYVLMARLVGKIYSCLVVGSGLQG